MKLELRPGDTFAVDCKSFMDILINFFQKFFSADNKSEYGHCGVITDTDGDTIESNKTINRYNIWKEYIGKKVLIVRADKMDEARFKTGIKSVEGMIGKIYPLHRFVFFILHIAKYVSVKNWLVCSELVAKFLCYAEIRHCQYPGTDVDTLVDEWRNYRGYTIIFEGVLKEDMK
jgi:hypothetical protein